MEFSPDYYYTDGHETYMMTTTDLVDMAKARAQRSEEPCIESLITLIAKRRVGPVRELLERDEKIVHLADGDNETLLHFAVFSDSYDLTRLFLQYGADPNRRDNEGQTALFRIVFATDTRIIGLLLEHGATLDVQDLEGNTVLHIAVLTKNYRMIKSLLDYGIDPMIYNRSNLIPLDFAVTRIDDRVILDERILTIFSRYTRS